MKNCSIVTDGQVKAFPTEFGFDYLKLTHDALTAKCTPDPELYHYIEVIPFLRIYCTYTLRCRNNS